MSALFASGSNFARLPKIATVMVMAALVGACGEAKPGGQTIATVDGKPITEAELAADMGENVRKADESKRNIALDSLINRKIFVAAAKEQGIDKDPNFKLELARQQEIMLAKRYLAQATAGVGSSISETDINRYLAANPQFGPGRKILLVDQIQFSIPTDKATLDEMKAAKTMPQLIEVLRRHRVEVQTGRANLDSSILPSAMYKGLLGSQSGEPLVLANGDATLAQVLVSATDAPLSNEQAQRIARRNLEQERVSQRLTQQAEALRGAAKIEFGQGYAQAKPGS